MISSTIYQQSSYSKYQKKDDWKYGIDKEYFHMLIGLLHLWDKSIFLVSWDQCHKISDALFPPQYLSMHLGTRPKGS